MTSLNDYGLADCGCAAQPLHAEIARLRALLRRLEWSGRHASGYASCPSCGGVRIRDDMLKLAPHDRHQESCELAAEIAKGGTP